MARHAKITASMAKDAGLTITETYEEVVSGSSIEERPEMIRLLLDLKALKWDIVIVVDISRLSRGDGSDQSKICNAFRLTGTRCLSDYRIYDLSKKDDLELFEHKLQSSRTEYKAITERLHRGTIEAVKDGFAAPGPVPYGLTRVRTRGGTIYEKNSEFENLKLITEYPLAASDPTWNGLIKLLNDLGIPSPKGNEWWSVATLKTVFTTPAYFGEVVYGARKTEEVLGDHFQSVRRLAKNDHPLVAKAKWEPFLDKERVLAALDRMQRKSPVPAGKPPASPLRGLLYCSKCGHALWYRAGRKGSGTAYYAHPASRSSARKACSCKSIPVRFLMKAIEQALLLDIEDMELDLHDGTSIGAFQDLKASESMLDKKIASAEQSKLKAYRRLDEGIIDDALFKQICSEIDARIQDATHEKDSIQGKLRQLDSPQRVSERIIKSKAAIAALQSENLAPDEINKRLKRLIKRIEYDNLAERWTHDHDVRLRISMR